MDAPYLIAEMAPRFRRLPGTQILLKSRSTEMPLSENAALEGVWERKQAAFMRWARDPAMFNEADVAENRAFYDAFFAARGPLRGRVLDIGGGWGLYRAWWDGQEDGCFTVHDPGIERFTNPPPPALKAHYARALALPAWFVEGYGESLPYRDASYDTVLIAQALDHCADPARVLGEAWRVLRPGGSIVVITGFELELEKAPDKPRRFLRRLASVAADPRRLYRAIRTRLLHREEPHIHHFDRGDVAALLENAGFVGRTESLVSERFRIYAIEGSKPG